ASPYQRVAHQLSRSGRIGLRHRNSHSAGDKVVERAQAKRIPLANSDNRTHFCDVYCLIDEAVALGEGDIAFIRRQEDISLAGYFEVCEQRVGAAVLNLQNLARVALVVNTN